MTLIYNLWKGISYISDQQENDKKLANLEPADN